MLAGPVKGQGPSLRDTLLESLCTVIAILSSVTSVKVGLVDFTVFSFNRRISLFSNSVLVSEGWQNKVIQTRWLQPQKFIFSQF